jgi:hypothetical protein
MTFVLFRFVSLGNSITTIPVSSACVVLVLPLVVVVVVTVWRWGLVGRHFWVMGSSGDVCVMSVFEGVEWIDKRKN